jgi:hypothetical protein
MRLTVTVLLLGAGGCIGLTVGAPPQARADEIAYLVNVTVRPGYDFSSADAALAYGQGICDKLAIERPYGLVVDDIKADFGATDNYQAAYLIGQAANELCPASIWQLRTSAAHYRPSGP